MTNYEIFDLERAGYKIYQNKTTFRFGLDSVLLSWFAKANQKSKCIDLGTGTGIVPILMQARYNCLDMTGIDIINESVEMANESIKLNKIEDKLKIEYGDIKDYYKDKIGQFDIVTSNPPYMKLASDSNSGKIQCINNSSNLEIARHEVHCNIEDVIKCASNLLHSKGKFYIVYKPDRLVSLIYYLREYKLEPKKILFVEPNENKESNIVLVEAIKDGKEEVKILKPLIIYDKDGSYTKEVVDIYRE